MESTIEEPIKEVHNSIENLELNNEELKKIYLKEYKILPNPTNYPLFTLPTPEYFSKFIEPVKNFLKYDISKYNSLIKETEEGPVIDLTKIPGIKNDFLWKKILFYLGGISDENDMYQYYEDDTNFPEGKEIEKTKNYGDYLTENAELFAYKFEPKYITDLFLALKEIGIDLYDEKNIYYINFRDTLFSSDENAILVLLAPSNNFWIKSEKLIIGEINYDKKLNDYTRIFYNYSFIEKFLTKVVSHKRCRFGLISSMQYHNLKSCIEGMLINYRDLLSLTKCLLLDQKCHAPRKEPPSENTSKKDDRNGGGSVENKKESKKFTGFLRDINKVINRLITLKAQIEENKRNKKNKKNDDYYLELLDLLEDGINLIGGGKFIILESEEEKMTDISKNYSIPVNLFSEKYLEYSEEEKAVVDLEGDKIIDYMVKLLDYCDDGDVKLFLQKNPIEAVELNKKK